MRAMADAQHGVVARWQLLLLGLGTDAIGRRVRSGDLVRLYPGVYAVGHAHLTLNGRRMAAVLAAGPDAVLSHRDAAALHRLRSSGGPRFEVTTSGAVRRVGGVVVRRTRWWPAGHVTVVDGIPVTTVARTVADLAGILRPEAMDSVFAQAELLHLDVGSLERIAADLRGRRGSGDGELRHARERFARYGIVLTRSEGEQALLAVLERFGVPAPMANHRADGDEIDAVWPDARAGIELDSWRYHRGKVRFVRDRAKLRRLTVAGWAILPFTAYDLRDDPRQVASQTRRCSEHGHPVCADRIPDGRRHRTAAAARTASSTKSSFSMTAVPRTKG